MTRYHISEDGNPRICRAQTADSCTAVGPDGENAPHGDFNSASAAAAFAEREVERAMDFEGYGASYTAQRRKDAQRLESIPKSLPAMDARIREEFPTLANSKLYRKALKSLEAGDEAGYADLADRAITKEVRASSGPSYLPPMLVGLRPSYEQIGSKQRGDLIRLQVELDFLRSNSEAQERVRNRRA